MKSRFMSAALAHMPPGSELIEKKKKQRYWGIGIIVVSLTIVGASGNSSAAENTGSLFCCFGGILFIISFLGTGGNNRMVYVQAQTAVQPVMMQPVIQQPVVHQQVAQPMQTAGAMKAQFEQNKKLEHLKIAQQREMARDYDSAVREYEAAGEFSEAGRVRALMQNMGQSNQAAPVQVNIGQVGNSVVQDSVVMANQQPSAQPIAAPQQVAPPVSNNVCSHCSAAITPGWHYCPACNNPLS